MLHVGRAAARRLLPQTLDEKLKFTFSIFDATNNGRIESPEVFQMLRMTMGRAHSDDHLQEIVDNYMQRFPDGMDYETFTKMFNVADLDKLTLALMDK